MALTAARLTSLCSHFADVLTLSSLICMWMTQYSLEVIVLPFRNLLIFYLMYLRWRTWGDLHSFFGEEITYFSICLFLPQHRYTHDLVCKIHMRTCKFVCASSDTRTTVSISSWVTCISIDCRIMVGALQYLTITRSVITYAIHVVFHIVHATYTSHLFAAKHIVRHFKGTIDHEIKPCSTVVSSLVVGYSGTAWLVIMILAAPSLSMQCFCFIGPICRCLPRFRECYRTKGYS